MALKERRTRGKRKEVEAFKTSEEDRDVLMLRERASGDAYKTSKLVKATQESKVPTSSKRVADVVKATQNFSLSNPIPVLETQERMPT
jgi:hypothetical protein